MDPRQVGLILGLEPVEAPARVLARQLMGTLHDHLAGCCETVCGDRHPEYFRQALRDGRCFSVQRDLAQLATRPEREPREAVRAFALVLLAATEPRPCESIADAAAALAEESADVPAAVLRFGADGRYTDDETAAIARELDEQDLQAARLRASLVRRSA